MRPATSEATCTLSSDCSEPMERMSVVVWTCRALATSTGSIGVAAATRGSGAALASPPFT